MYRETGRADPARVAHHASHRLAAHVQLAHQPATYVTRGSRDKRADHAEQTIIRRSTGPGALSSSYRRSPPQQYFSDNKNVGYPRGRLRDSYGSRTRLDSSSIGGPMPLVRSRRDVLLAAGVALLATSVVTVWIAVDLRWRTDDAVGRPTDDPTCRGIACAMCLRARARHTGRMRLFWTLLSCATASWTIAETIWGAYALILQEEVPSPSWAERRLPRGDPIDDRGARHTPGDDGQRHAQGPLGARRRRRRRSVAVSQLDARSRPAVAQHRPQHRGRNRDRRLPVRGRCDRVLHRARHPRNDRWSARLVVVPARRPARDGPLRQHLHLSERDRRLHQLRRQRHRRRLDRRISRDRARRVQLNGKGPSASAARHCLAPRSPPSSRRFCPCCSR